MFVISLPAVAIAGVYNVTNSDDAGPGSYRQAMLDAQSDDAAIIIDFDPGLFVQLTSGPVVFEHHIGPGACPPITLNGHGSTIDGGGAFRVLRLFCVGALSINDLTLQNARSTDSDGGGALFYGNGSTFNASNVRFLDNVTEAGHGGAFAAGATIVVRDSLFLGNRAEAGDSGAHGGSHTDVARTSYVDNFAANDGGAGAYGNLTATNVTYSSNSAGNGGGALRLGGSAISLRHVTFVDNSAASGDHLFRPFDFFDWTLFALVMTGPPGTQSCGGSPYNVVTSNGYNYATDDSCPFGAASGDVVNGANSQLLALDDNGGNTPTHLPAAGSPLIDAIAPGDCAVDIVNDQRGVARPQGDGCDIGAVEVLAVLTHTVTPSAGAGGSIDPDTPQTVEHGATTAFTVAPDAGYTADVGGTCGGGLDGTTFTTDPVTADCTVEATFTLIDLDDQIFTDRFESVELQMPQF